MDKFLSDGDKLEKLHEALSKKVEDKSKVFYMKTSKSQLARFAYMIAPGLLPEPTHAPRGSPAGLSLRGERPAASSPTRPM